jgi:hypothetical protein
MNCPKCSHFKSDIVDTRKKSLLNWRRHKCKSCKQNFYTVEVERDLLLMLVQTTPRIAATIPFLEQLMLPATNLGENNVPRSRPRSPRKREIKTRPVKPPSEKKVDRDWFKSDRAKAAERKK